MDACDFNGVKTENNAAIMKLHSFKCVAKFFRGVEFCFVFILLLWIFTKLPFALKISSEYFLQIVELMLSPVFIFIICNFIIITILFNSSKLHNVAATEMYHSSFLENAEFSSDFQLKSRKSVYEDGEIVYEDKQMIFEENTVKNQALFGSEYKQMIFEENTVKNQALFDSEYKQMIFEEKALKNEVLCGKQMLFEENTVKNQGLCGSKYKEMIFEESTGKNVDFFGSEYRQMIFEENTGKNVDFFSSEYRQMIFEENTGKNEDFFGSEYRQMIFEENTGKNQDFFGSEHKQMIFEETTGKNQDFFSSEYRRMIFEENTGKNQDFFGSECKQMIVEENTGQNVDFFGSEYRQMIFEENTGKNQVLCGSKYGQMIFEEKNQEKLFGFDETEIVTTNKALMKPKVLNQSEKMITQNVEEISVNYCRKLTNSGDFSPETEKFLPEVTDCGEFLLETVEKVDELSNEEFQKAIENFIAKQIKFHQQEKVAIVPHSQA